MFADLFRQHFRREVRQAQYVLHFAYSAEEALGKLAEAIEPQLIVSDHQHARHGRALRCCGSLRRGGLISRS